MSFAGILQLSAAAAEISVTPLRQVLQNSNDSARYEISNASDRIVDVKINWIDLTATETGYRPASASERANISAAPHLKLQPAFVSLQPGGRASVTVGYNPNAGSFPQEERRSHLLFSTKAVRTSLRKAGGGLKADAGLNISTPVIMRRPGRAPKAEIDSVRLLRNEEGLLDLEAKIALRSAISAFGKVAIYFRPDGAPQATIIKTE